MKRRATRWPAHVLSLARAEKERLAALQGGSNLTPDPGPGTPRPKLTKLEARYLAHLECERAAGRLLVVRWEPFRLVLRHGGGGQKGMTYAPDALVVTAPRRSPRLLGGHSVTGPRVELHEVKPVKDDGLVLWLGDSRTKLLAAVELHRGVPWTFVLVTPDGPGWKRTVL